jgi:hypothetical protein
MSDSTDASVDALSENISHRPLQTRDFAKQRSTHEED